MQIFTMRYNLQFRKLTLYGLTRPQSIRKSKQISGQTISSSPQDLDFNPNFAKNRDIPVVRNSVTGPVTPTMLTTDALKVARYSFPGPIPPKFEHKLRRYKQSFGKIATLYCRTL